MTGEVSVVVLLTWPGLRAGCCGLASVLEGCWLTGLRCGACGCDCEVADTAAAPPRPLRGRATDSLGDGG